MCFLYWLCIHIFYNYVCLCNIYYAYIYLTAWGAHSSFWPPSLLALFAYWWQSVGIICITGDGHYPWVHAAWAAKACWICALDSVRCVWLQTHVIFLLLDRSLADMRPDFDWYERKYWAWSLTSALEALEGQNSGYDESEWVDSLQESCVQKHKLL